MIIRSILLSNFGLYAGEQRFEPCSTLDGSRPITLVGGLNGRGKTSLLEAVLLNLYGNRSPALRGKEETYTGYLESLIHKGANRAEGSAVELQLETPARGGGKPITLRVRRSWRVGNKRATERLEVWRSRTEDESDPPTLVEDPQLANTWDTYIEELIPSGLSWLFFFDGEKIATLAEEEETSESLRVAIRSLLGLDLVDRLIGDLGGVIKRNRLKLKEAEGAEIVSALEAELDALRLTEMRLLHDLGHQNNKVLRAAERLREKEEAYQRAGGRLAESRGELERQQNLHREHAANIRSEINQAATGPLPLLLAVPLLHQVGKAVEDSESVLKARAVLPVLQQRDRTLLNKLQDYFRDFTKLAEVVTFLEADRADIEALAMQNPPIELSPVGQGQLASLLESVHELIAKAEELSSEYHSTEQALDQVGRHLLFQFDVGALNRSLRGLSRVAKVLAGRKHAMGRLEQQLREVQGQIKQTEQGYQSALDKYMKQLDDADDAARTIALAQRSQETMRAFGREVTLRKVQALERAVTAAFNELTHKTLATSIRIHPETLQISLYIGDNDEVLKSRLSSGEKQMLAVSILWGLAKASGRDLPVIIDTPMGRLDSSHRMNFVTRYLPNASHQVLVLSTDTEIVGPYLTSLTNAIGRTYLLRYDPKQVRTTVERGRYFEARGGIAE